MRVLISNYVAVALGFLCPFLAIILCYSGLLRCLARCAGPRKRRAVHMVTAVVVAFLLCFLPYHLSRCLHLHAVLGGWSCRVALVLQRAVVLTLCLASCNSVLNPLLYYYCTRMFCCGPRRPPGGPQRPPEAPDGPTAL